MKKFINDDFLLQSDYSKALYHNYAEDKPLIDFHCHLDPAEIAGDKKWDNIAELWLGGDHYKWRAMRSDGIDERYCTGQASAREKFQKFAEAMPHILRNPMYHRCHLALAEQSSRGEDAAKTLFHARMARECNRRTLYASAEVEAEAALLLARYDAAHYTEEMEQYRRASRSLGLEHQYRLTLIQHYLNVGDMTQAAAELDALAGESASTPEEQGDYLRLRGELAMRSREYQTAAEQLRRAEQLELSVGGSESVLGPLYAMLEQCYREMEDYKEAYRYAAKQIPR